MNSFYQWLAGFRPQKSGADHTERFRACLGALIGIFVTGITSYWLVGNSPQLPMLIAPLGASAVLLFAVPNGPLAQPWSIFAGNTLSAMVGVTALMLFDDLAVTAAFAVCGATAVMFLTRSLHPPGGAVALTTVLGGDTVLAQGYMWALTPVGFESALLLLTGLIYNNATGRPYPPPPPERDPHKTSNRRPSERVGFTEADLDVVLTHYEQVLDINRSELADILRQTEMHAIKRRMGVTTCTDIMSRKVITLGPEDSLRHAWSLLQTHRLHALPVLDEDSRPIGIVSIADLLPSAAPEGFFKRLWSRKEALKLSVSDIMTSNVDTVRSDAHIASLAPVLSDDGRHQVPVVDDDGLLVGIISQADLIAALYRQPLPD